jgi:glycosyltransferase involved in cell wall biosynthesis
MSSKQPHVLFIFETNECIYNESLNEKFTIFTTSLLQNEFDRIIARNKIHVFVTVGTEYKVFNHLFNKYGNKLNKNWIHKTHEEIKNNDISSSIMNVFSNVCILSKENNTISYYITAYNSGNIIYRPYYSLLNQTYLNWELVIIDDSEETNFDTEKLVKEIASNDFRVRYFRSKHSGFIGEVKNYAARLCTGYVICELDHDDELTHELTAWLHKSYSTNPDVVFVSTNDCELYDDTKENHIYGDCYSFGYGSYINEWYNNKWRSVSQSGLINITTITDIVGVPNHIRTWRSSALFEIGYNNSNLYVADDYEVILRTIIYCAKNNKQMMHLPILGYFQYRNRIIGNHTFKRLDQIRSLQSHCNKIYSGEIDKAIKLMEMNYYPDRGFQKLFDNYNGRVCTPFWDMPWNWNPNNINSVNFIGDEYKVSVVISTYNRPELLLKAIQSCLKQTYQNFEIIIIGDNCPRLNYFMENLYNGPKNKIRWWNLSNNSNNGGTTPKNYALRTSVRTNLVCYLDDDNSYTDTHLESLVNKFKNDDELSFAFSSMRMGEYDILCKEPKLYRIDTSTFMHKKSLLEKYGYWKSHAEAGYSHDYEIVSRWVKGNEKWAATEEITMIYNMETGSQNNPKFIYEVYDDQK